jgi:hypothetical protein
LIFYVSLICVYARTRLRYLVITLKPLSASHHLGAFKLCEMKEIKLSHQGKNKNKYVTLVDDEDFDFLNQWKWFSFKGGKTRYVIRDVLLNGERVKINMHRLIMNTPDTLEVDHIDHNGLNNQKHNLRNCIHRENCSNRSPWGRSPYLGVAYQQRGRGTERIFAKLKSNGIRYHLGYFETEQDAAIAYDKKAKELLGEFANLNFK